MSSSRTPGKSLRWTDLRSDPLPFTRRTRVSRPRWSRSAVLIEVLPPPHTTSEVSAPIRREAWTRRSTSERAATSASFQRERIEASPYHGTHEGGLGAPFVACAPVRVRSRGLPHVEDREAV